MRLSKTVAVVVGSLAALVSLALLVGGSALLWAHTTQRDDDGYYTSSTELFETDSYAITSEEIDLGTDQGRGEWSPVGDIGTVRLRVERTDGAPVFIGIARQADIAALFEGVEHDRLVDLESDPFSARYEREPGDEAPPDPTAADIWAASSAGPGPQTVQWDLDEGTWGVAVMNADGSRGLEVNASGAIKTDWLLPISLGLLVVGLLAAVAAAVLLVVGLRRGGPGASGPDGPGGAGRVPEPTPDPPVGAVSR